MPKGITPETSGAECATDGLGHGWSGGQAGHAPAEGGTSARERIAALVHTLEHDVIPRLVRWHRGGPDPAAVLPSPEEFDRFVALSIEGSEPQIAEAVDALRRRGISVETLFLDLFAPAARRLGEMWSDDLCDFSTVTVGLGRLQRLLRELGPAFTQEVEVRPTGLRILLAQPDDEQHSFGLSMVAEFFRRAGWSVDGGLGGSGLDPEQAVRDEWYDAVGLSVGCDKTADWVTGRIAALRRASRNSAVVVLVGGPLVAANPEWGGGVGADASVTDGGTAPALAESLIAAKAKSGPGAARPG